MKVIDPVTGKKAEIGTRRTIIEAYKDVKMESLLNQDINNRLKNNNIKVLLMDNEYLNYKSEIEKINQRVKEYL